MNKTQACKFTTSRLVINEWHSLEASECNSLDLSSVVANMLTEPVTQSLPPGWQGAYDIERAKQWINERDQESTTLLVVEQDSKEAIGLMILFEFTHETTNDIEIRLGYLLAENAWGKGYATELLSGFVEWCRQNNITSIAGGVGKENIASQRVLAKAGFKSDSEEVNSAETIYRLVIK